MRKKKAVGRALRAVDGGAPEYVTPVIGLREMARRDGKFLLVVVGLAILLPFIHLIFISGNPTFNNPIIDAHEYVATARLLIDPSHAFKDSLYHSAFYPWYLAAVFHLFGTGLLMPKLLQILLNGVICFFLYALAYKLFSQTTARVSAVIWVVYGPVIFYTVELIPVTWTFFLYLLSLYCVVLAVERPAWHRWLAAGAMMGLAAIARPEILPFAVVVGVGILLFRWPQAHPLPRKFTWAALTALGVAGPLVVVGLANLSTSGKFIMLPSNSGLNCYLGNNPNYMHTIGIRPDATWEAVTNLPVKEGFSTSDKDPRNNAFYYRKSLAYMRNDPAGWLRCMLYKTRTLLGGYELPSELDMYTFRHYSPLLAVLLWRIGSFGFPFGVLLPLALLGIAVTRRRLRDLWWQWAFLCCMLVTLIGFHNTTRYRLALLPVLVISAAAALVWLVEQYRQKQPRALGIGVIAVVGLAVICGLPYYHFSQTYNFPAEMYAAAGMVQQEESGGKEGVPFLREAAKLSPNSVETHFDLAWALQQQGDKAHAEEEYRKVVAINPLSDKGHNALGALLVDSGRVEEGMEHFRTAMRINPRNAEPYLRLGLAYSDQQAYAQAVEYLQQAVALNPDNGDAHYDLAVALSKAGKDDQATQEYQESARYLPDNPDIYNSMALIAVNHGRYQEAADDFTQAAKLAPDNPGYKKNVDLVNGIIARNTRR